MKKIKGLFSKFDLIIITVSIIIIFVVLNLPFKAKPFGDDTFHVEAKNISLYLKGDIGFDKVTITKAPGPVFFYAPIYSLVPSESSDNMYWNYAVVYTNIILLVCMLLIFRIGRAMFSKEIGLLTVILFFLFPIQFYYSLGILAEIPAFFSLTLALYGWTKILSNTKHKIGWILFILGITFLVLNRPNTLLFIPIAFIFIIYTYFKRKEFFKQYGLKIIISLFVIGFCSFGVLQGSKKVTGSKSDKKQEELLAYVAHHGRFQFREEPLDFRFWESDVRMDSKDYQNWIKSYTALNLKIEETGRSYVDVYKEFLIDDIIEHPFLYARQFFVKCFYGHIYIINSIQPQNFKLLFFKGKTGYILFLIIVNIINLLILLGFFIFLFKQKSLLNYWPFLTIIIALLIFHGLIYMEPRYLFPSRVALYIMSAIGLYKIGFIKKATLKISEKLL